MTKKYTLKLYITGDTGNSQTALRNLKGILETKIKGFYTLEIIDVLKNPESAIEDRILATPTLIKVSPEPEKRIIGDLSDNQKVLLGLNFNIEPQKPTSKELQSIHEQACIYTSDALARLIGKQAIVDIANQRIEKADDLSLPIDPTEKITAACLPVSGQVKGAALLLFSQQTAFHLSDLLIKKEPGTTKQLDELDKSALKELGNIVCGSYFATLSNHTKIKMIEHVAKLTFNMLGVITEQAITNFCQNTEDVLAITTEFNFTVPMLKSHCFKTHFLVLFQTAQYEAIVGSLEQVAV